MGKVEKQPRWIAFLRSKKLPDDSDYFQGNGEFSAFISREIKEFKKLNGLPKYWGYPLSESEQGGFTFYLLDKYEGGNNGRTNKS